MPKFINRYVGRLVSCERKNDDKDFSYAIGCLGHIELYESQNRHPGLVFVRYYFNLDGDDLDYTTNYIFTSCGELDVDGDILAVRNTQPNGSTYVFEIKSRG